MSVKFRPMPVLTGIAAVMLAILITLGVWQYQRLQWKTALLAEVEASVTAPPLTSLADLERAIAEGEPVDFRRIAVEAESVDTRTPYHVFKTQTGGIFWDAFQPIKAQGRTIYARLDTLSSEEKTACGLSVETGLLTRYGYVRKDYDMGRIEGWVKSKPNRMTNRWFKFNQDGSWGEGLSTPRLSHYIDIEPNATSAETLPIRRPEIRNNHRDYMLTWFSFAGLLLIFYALIHKRAGRLSW